MEIEGSTIHDACRGSRPINVNRTPRRAATDRILDQQEDRRAEAIGSRPDLDRGWSAELKRDTSNLRGAGQFLSNLGENAREVYDPQLSGRLKICEALEHLQVSDSALGLFDRAS